MFHTLVDLGAEDDFIDQSKVVELGMIGGPPNSYGRVVDGHYITLYRKYSLLIRAIDASDIEVDAHCKMYAVDINRFNLILGMN